MRWPSRSRWRAVKMGAGDLLVGFGVCRLVRGVGEGCPVGVAGGGAAGGDVITVSLVDGVGVGVGRPFGAWDGSMKSVVMSERVGSDAG